MPDWTYYIEFKVLPILEKNIRASNNSLVIFVNIFLRRMDEIKTVSTEYTWVI